MVLNEPAVAYSKQRYTIEEYLEMENASTEKHEYYQGEIFVRAVSTLQNIIVSGNILVAVMNQSGDGRCHPFSSDARIHVENNTLFAYPDVSVFVGEFITLNDDDMNFLNPTVIFEVLSSATRHCDKNEKFKLYRDIPTLKSYVLVEPEEINIEAFHISSTSMWEHTKYNDINSSLQLPHLNISLELRGIYDGTRVLGQG